MRNLLAESLRLPRRLPWARSANTSGPRRKVGDAGAGGKTGLRQKPEVERGVDVLEEIWRSADRERGRANLTICSRLLRKFRSVRTDMKAEVFGACLCCKAALGLSPMTATPWLALCPRCQDAVNRDDSEPISIHYRD